MFFSQVTGKPRRIDLHRGLGGRASTGQGFVTQDITDEQNDQASHPIYNLIEFNETGREVIIERNNGLHAFALFDAQGNLVDSVPDTIAKDHTVPSPFTARLNPAISCIRCHASQSGIRDAPNEVAILLRGEVEIFDDLGVGSARFEALDHLAGLYAGDFSKRIRRARDDYEDAVFAVTGGMDVQKASDELALIVDSYEHTLVTASIACLEFGYRAESNESAIQWLRDNVGRYPEIEAGISFEDPTVAALKVGIPVLRKDFERVYADTLNRILQGKDSEQ
jgi:hypothetical protein